MDIKIKLLINTFSFFSLLSGLELAAYQDVDEDVSCLPTLKVSDIRKEEKRIPLDKIESGS